MRVHAKQLGVVLLGVDGPHQEAHVGGAGGGRLVYQTVRKAFHAQLDGGILALEAAWEVEAHVREGSAGGGNAQNRISRRPLGTDANLFTGVHEVAHAHIEGLGVAGGIQALVGAFEEGTSQLALEARERLREALGGHEQLLGSLVDAAALVDGRKCPEHPVVHGADPFTVPVVGAIMRLLGRRGRGVAGWQLYVGH